jgi:hypothetical protein
MENTEAKTEITHRHIDDGREDCGISINGLRLLTIHEEGRKLVGMSYEDAQELVKAIGVMIGEAAKSQLGVG